MIVQFLVLKLPFTLFYGLKDNILYSMKRFSLLLLIISVTTINIFAQQIKITGRVVDVIMNDPIPNVKVVTSDSSDVAISNENGEFSVYLTDSTRYISFSHEDMFPVKYIPDRRLDIFVIMEPNRANKATYQIINGVVRKPENLTFNYSKIYNSEIDGFIYDNVTAAIDGRINGSMIADNPANQLGSDIIRFRGIQTITGTNAPLVVVDGVPMEIKNLNNYSEFGTEGGIDWGNVLSDINMEMVEEISVMQGAQAASIYGGRAAYGAIIINTDDQQKQRTDFGVTIRSGVKFEEVYNLPELQREYGAGDELSIVGYEDASGFYDLPYDADGDGVDDYESFDLIMDYSTSKNFGLAFNTLAGEYVDMLEGTVYEKMPVMYLPWFSWEERGYYYKYPVRWQAPEKEVDNFFEQGITYTTAVSMNGANDNGSFGFNYTREDNDGFLPNQEHYRNYVTFNARTELYDDIFLKGNVNYSNIKGKGRPVTGLNSDNPMLSLFSAGQRQIDNSHMRLYYNLDQTQAPWNRISGEVAGPYKYNNPYWSRYKNYNTEERDHFYGSLGLSYDYLDLLKVRATVYGNYYTWEMQNQIEKTSFLTSGFETYTHAMREMNYDFNFTIDYDLEYDFTISANLGASAMDQKYEINGARTQGGLVELQKYTLGNSVDNIISTDYYGTEFITSIYASILLDWKKILYLDAYAHNAWMTRYNEAYTLNYSVNGSFLFTQLKWFEKIDWLEFGKLRGTFAMYNSTKDIELYTHQYTRKTLYSDTLSSTNTMNYYNEIRPEKITSWEAGMDLSLFKNRLNMSFTYYNVTTKDMINIIPLSASSGTDFTLIRGGEMNNSGIEISMNALLYSSAKVDWQLKGNYTNNKNKVVDLPWDYQLIEGPAGTSVWAVEGMPLGQIMGSDFIYDNEGNIVVYNSGTNAGVPVATQNNTTLGYTAPDYTIGLGTEFRYKRWYLSALFDMQSGGSYYSSSYMMGMSNGLLQETVEEGIRENGVNLNTAVSGDVIVNPDGTISVSNIQPNDIYADYIQYLEGYENGVDNQNVFSNDFIKLKELKLSVSLNDKRTFFFRGVTLSVWGRNLLTFNLDNDNVDPDALIFNGTPYQGIDYGVMPMIRTYGFDLKFSL